MRVDVKKSAKDLTRSRSTLDPRLDHSFRSFIVTLCFPMNQKPYMGI